MRNLFRHIAQASLRLGAAQEGASAVEFALIAPALVALLVAFFQVAVFLFAQQALQNAANEAGRLFMTGQTQADTQAQFANPADNSGGGSLRLELLRDLRQINSRLAEAAGYPVLESPGEVPPGRLRAEMADE